MDLQFKDIPDEMKHLSLSVEEGVQLCPNDEDAARHQKANYQRFCLDFFKADSGRLDAVDLNLPQLKGNKGKRGAGQKLIINAYFLCFGDSVKIDLQAEEGGKAFTSSVVLKSGDGLAISSAVDSFKYSISTAGFAGTKPTQLVLREGSLLVTVERE